MKVETLKIEGMHCHHCADLIRNSLSLVKGIAAADVMVGAVTVSYEESLSSREDIEKAITRFGYRVMN